MSKFTFENNRICDEKKYLQFKVTDLRNLLSTDEYDKFWAELVDHHCMNGNDSMMVLERFYYSKSHFVRDRDMTKEDFDLPYNDFNKFSGGAYSSSLVGYHVVREVLKNGYKLCNDSDRLSVIKGFDGILLNISW